MKLFFLLLFVAMTRGQHQFSQNLARMVLHTARQEGLVDANEELAFEKYLQQRDESAHPQAPNTPEAKADSNPMVETTSGLVEGITTESHSFYGIPYAEPPIGELRFQPPQPIKTPKNIDGTSNEGLQCHQFETACITGANVVCNRLPMDEDCLILNVFVPITIDLSDPATPPSERLPVLFYIHGGAFFAGKGTSSSLEGQELANVANTVVVAINYRLGALGFLVHEETGYPSIEGNQGIKDQQLALKWVQDNVARFGGDKERVTIFGNSAGAQSVMFHTLSEVSEPLYTRAIQQSNPTVFSYQTPEDSRQQITKYLLTSLRCNETMTERECLMSSEALAFSNTWAFVALRALLNGDTMGLIEPYRPVIDGVEFTDQPLHLFRDGKWNKDKNMIIGVNTEELHDFQFISPQPLQNSRAIFAAVNYVIFGIGTTDTVIKKYTAAYPPPDDNWGYTFGIEMGHLYFVCPSRAMARYASQTATGSTKVYFYANEHPVLSGACQASNNVSEEECYFATHAAEVRFVFRTKSNPDEDDQSVENQFSTYWGSFARTGSTSNGLESPVGEFEDWPKYTPDVEQPLRKEWARNFGGKYAGLVPLLIQAAEGGSGEVPSEPWQNIRIKAPASAVEGNYEEEICDFWDSIGYYMDPIPLSTTTTFKKTTTKTTTATTSTTSRAAKTKVHQFLFLLTCIFWRFWINH